MNCRWAVLNSKVRGSIFDGTMSSWMEKNWMTRSKTRSSGLLINILFTPREKRTAGSANPYFKGKTLFDYNLARIGADVKEKAYPSTSSCPHIPILRIGQMARDAGHQMANYEKVLHKGLKGIREEVAWQMAQLDQPYDHYSLKEKKDFYKAVLIF